MMRTTRFPAFGVLVALTASCGLEEPGSELRNPETFLGCYQAVAEELIILESNSLLFEASGMRFSGEFRRDKHGPFFLATPGFLLSANGSEPIPQDWPGTLVRLDDLGAEHLLITNENGHEVIADRVDCETNAVAL